MHEIDGGALGAKQATGGAVVFQRQSPGARRLSSATCQLRAIAASTCRQAAVAQGWPQKMPASRKGAAVARERAGPTRSALASLADGASLLHAATGIRETVRRRTEMRKAEAVRAGSNMRSQQRRR